MNEIGGGLMRRKKKPAIDQRKRGDRIGNQLEEIGEEKREVVELVW